MTAFVYFVDFVDFKNTLHQEKLAASGHDPTVVLTAVMPIRLIQNETVRVTGISNREFLELQARPGRVGLSGGQLLVDKMIYRAQRHLDESERWGSWSHAFLFQGVRADGHHWVIESDLQFHRRHIHLGVQENRMAKYYDERLYSTLAVLDFGLNEEEITSLMREGLGLVAARTRYSLRELVGTLIAMRHPELRGQTNVLARDCSMFCSAFVQHLFRKAGLDLAPGVDGKNTTPEDISRTSVPHVTYLLDRKTPRSRLAEMNLRLHRRVRARVRQLKKRIEKNR